MHMDSLEKKRLKMPARSVKKAISKQTKQTTPPPPPQKKPNLPTTPKQNRKTKNKTTMSLIEASLEQRGWKQALMDRAE